MAHGAPHLDANLKGNALKIDSQELRQLAATQPPRMDMYAGIHKALRALMADTLLAVGRMDVGDELETAQTTQRVVELLEALPGIGHVRAAAIMERLGIAASRRVLGLGIHQRRALVDFIDKK